MIATTTRLNTPGPELAQLSGVHAITDVTGFGLAGHALEMARDACCDLQIDWAQVPLLPGVRALAARGMVTGASGRNWAGYGEQVRLPAGFAAEDRALLTDPQTSGGLLVACESSSLDAVLAVFREHGFEQAAVAGSVMDRSGQPILHLTCERLCWPSASGGGGKRRDSPCGNGASNPSPQESL